METMMNTLKGNPMGMGMGVGSGSPPIGGEGNSGYSIQGLVQSLSLTGNIMIDSFIIMNAFAFAKEWGEIIVTFLIKIGKSLFFGISHYIISYVKSKLTGRIVFRSEVKEDNPLYKVLFNNIIASNIEGDIQEDWKFKWLQIEKVFSAGDHFEQFKKNEYYHNRAVDLNIDYNSKNDVKLEFSQSFGMSDKKNLIFKYMTKPSKKYDNPFFHYSPRTFYIRINWVQHDTTSYKGEEEIKGKTRELSFDMILFDVPQENITKSAYFQIFYAFLEERFHHIFENMIFSYELKFKASAHSVMYNYIYTSSVKEDNYMCMSEGLLKYGDDNTDDISEIIACGTAIHKDDIQGKDSKKLSKTNFVNMSLRPANSDFDVHKNIQVIPCGSKDEVFRQTINTLLQIANVNSIISSNQGYFQYKKKAIVIQDSNIVLLKKGQIITQNEVYDTFQYMITENINRSKKTNTSKNISKKQMTIYKWSPEAGGWSTTLLSQRSFDTIYLASKFKASIIKEFDNFVRKEKLYRKVEVPYRKGIMFYGPPGTGKTSLVKAIAYEYQIPLYMIDVNGEGINDDTIVNILNSLGGNGLKILLFEDIDTAFADKEKMSKEEKYNIQYNYKNQRHEKDNSEESTKNIEQQPRVERKFLTYSGLLNAFDGVMSNQTGVITILTTNHIEKLGDAFIRPGRVDARFELKECNREQIVVMVRSFLNKSCQLFEESKNECLENDEEQKKWDLIRKDNGASINKRIHNFATKITNEKEESMFKPCEIQSYLLKYIDDIDDLFGNYDELLQGRDPNTFGVSNHNIPETSGQKTEEPSIKELEDSFEVTRINYQ